MVCVYCRSATKVLNSRPQRISNRIWRRRKCVHCLSVFTTVEQADLAGALMVKPSIGQLIPFSRDKLFITIYDSCRHRASAADDATALNLIIVSTILKAQTAGVVNRDDIVRAAHQVLSRFDEAAATAYVAYHPL